MIKLNSEQYYNQEKNMVYMYRNAFAIDKEINFSALLLELMGGE